MTFVFIMIPGYINKWSPVSFMQKPHTNEIPHSSDLLIFCENEGDRIIVCATAEGIINKV